MGVLGGAMAFGAVVYEIMIHQVVGVLSIIREVYGKLMDGILISEFLLNW